MATYFYGVNIGAEDSTVTIATSTTGKDVEVAVNSSTNVATRDALEIAIEKLKVAIIRAPYPPL
ncbi:hypothetical protein ACN9MB_09100 [Dyella kyungheensis]|jgi:hypothetical protein|uniref:hypothetical protein n=1 Tax=Dyella kyungheensis TaxID=1242174 RepID=UPI003CED6051